MNAPTPEPAAVDLDALERLERRATEAPWLRYGSAPYEVYPDPDGYPDDDGPYITSGSEREADAELIVALRNAASKLIRAARDRDGARDALRRIQERYDEVRTDASRLRETLREVLALYDGCEPNGLVLPDFVSAATVARWRNALDPDAPVEPARDGSAPPEVLHIRQIGAYRHNLCSVVGGEATWPSNATCEDCKRAFSGGDSR